MLNITDRYKSLLSISTYKISTAATSVTNDWCLLPMATKCMQRLHCLKKWHCFGLI